MLRVLCVCCISLGSHWLPLEPEARATATWALESIKETFFQPCPSLLFGVLSLNTRGPKQVAVWRTFFFFTPCVFQTLASSNSPVPNHHRYREGGNIGRNKSNRKLRYFMCLFCDIKDVRTGVRCFLPEALMSQRMLFERKIGNILTRAQYSWSMNNVAVHS